MTGAREIRAREATPAEMAQVLRSSHALWGDGMGVDDYLAFNLAQKETPWGRERYRFMIGVDVGGRIVSSVKLLTLPGRFGGRDVRLAGIGALFTPPGERGHGHGARLVERCLESARRDGCPVVLLMSEIGPSYYQRLGFRPVPATEAACMATLPAPWPGEPDWMQAREDPFDAIAGLRTFRDSDLESLVTLHAASGAGPSLGLHRDRPAWDHLLARIGDGHRRRRDVEDRIWVIDGTDGPVAYAILKEASPVLRWREHGVRPGAESRLHDLFWAALATARQRGMKRLEGWCLPGTVSGRPLYPIARRERNNPIVMVRPLDPEISLPRFDREEDCRVWELDSF